MTGSRLVQQGWRRGREQETQIHLPPCSLQPILSPTSVWMPAATSGCLLACMDTVLAPWGIARGRSLRGGSEFLLWSRGWSPLTTHFVRRLSQRSTRWGHRQCRRPAGQVSYTVWAIEGECLSWISAIHQTWIICEFALSVLEAFKSSYFLLISNARGFTFCQNTVLIIPRSSDTEALGRRCTQTTDDLGMRLNSQLSCSWKLHTVALKIQKKKNPHLSEQDIDLFLQLKLMTDLFVIRCNRCRAPLAYIGVHVDSHK